MYRDSVIVNIISTGLFPIMAIYSPAHISCTCVGAIRTSLCWKFALTRYLKAGTSFPWTTGFSSTAHLHEHPSLEAERAYLIVWIAADYSQLGASEPRNTHESLKRAAHAFQVAAGCLSFLTSRMVSTPPPAPLDQQAPCLAQLMLAQAQECFWQKAVMDSLKATTIAKLAQSVSDLYATCAQYITSASLPSDWSRHIECKRWHFAAAASYRKSCDDLDHRRHADELGRLMLASTSVHRAQTCVSRTMLPAVTRDLQSLQQVIQTNLRRAEKDNELIYLEAPTHAASLPEIGSALLAKDLCPSQLRAPLAYLKAQASSAMPIWFGRLVTYGIDVAVRLYEDRKTQFLQHDLEASVMELDEALSKALASMHTHSLLQRLATPHRVPPKWFEYVTHIRTCEVSELYERLKMMDETSQTCHALFNQLKTYAAKHPHETWTNVLDEYDHTLMQAASSDAQILAKLHSVEDLLKTMERGQMALHEWAMPVLHALDQVYSTHTGEIRMLRVQVEQLEDAVKERQALVLRARAEAESDDIGERLMQAARERHLGETSATEASMVDPAELQDVMDEAFQRYTVYVQELQASASLQKDRIRQMQHDQTCLLRCADLAQALDAQALAWDQVESAYTTWEALQHNMEEGTAFYNKLYDMLRRLADNNGLENA